MTSKECTLCFNSKTCQEFYKDRHAKDGYSSACKKCRSRQIAKAAQRRRVKGLISDDARSLLDLNHKYLNHYLNDYQLRNLKYLVIPVWLKGAFQPNIGGVYLHRQGKGPTFLSVYTALGGTHYALFHYSTQQVAEILTSQQYELLSPERVAELKIADVSAI